MPRRSRGPRLYLRTGRIDARTGKPLPDLYYIRDGAVERGTGCSKDSLRDAEIKLGAYIAEKGAAPDAAAQRPRDPSQVSIAAVLGLYATDRAPQLADPKSTAGRIETLDAWWGDKKLSDINGASCREYVAYRTEQRLRSAKTSERCVTAQGARRELEDLSAAVGLWEREKHLEWRPIVVMPEKGESPRDALTRAQGARLLKAALGYKIVEGKWQRLPKLTRARRRHMARLLLIGFYTGTRPGAIMALLWQESPLQAWVDLDKPLIHRRGRAEKETKKRRPPIKIPPRLLSHLRRWARLDAAQGEKEERAIASVIHYGAQPIKSVKGSFAAIVADAGLSEKITPHWLRHTAATWLMEAGADPWDAAGYLGMSMDILERCYGHHRPDYQAAVAASPRRNKRT